MAVIAGHFEKVSFKEYLNALIALKQIDREAKDYEEKVVAAKEAWEGISLPVRATTGSAGYDFCLPAQVSISANTPVTIPTGIRVKIEDGWYLEMVPRSGLGFRYGMKLANTVGVIDSDYYYADNEGHIMLKVSTRTQVTLETGDRFAQGIFMPHGITDDDKPMKDARRGGFGSTGA